MCVKKEGRNATFIKVLLCGRHIHKHLFLPTLGPRRHLPEGHGEDGKEMKLVKLLSDLSAVRGVDRGQPGFRAQRKRRLGQTEEGHPALVGPVDHRWSGTSLCEQWELVRIRQIWGQIRWVSKRPLRPLSGDVWRGHCYTWSLRGGPFPPWDLALPRLCSGPVCLHPKYLHGTSMSAA